MTILVSPNDLLVMIKAQERLNEKYNGDHWRAVVSVGKAKFAFMEEVSEFATEIEPTWKWWGRKTERKFDFQKALFELVDVIHFGLLLILHGNNEKYLEHMIDSWEGPVPLRSVQFEDDPHDAFASSVSHFLNAVNTNDAHYEIIHLLNLMQIGGEMIGAKPDEIYRAYILKNELNHKRVDGGVMEGRYDKSKEVGLELVR